MTGRTPRPQRIGPHPRIDVAVPGADGDDTRAAREDVLVNWTAPTAAAPTASTQMIRSARGRRDAHNLRVVARTRLHDGAFGGALGAAGVISCPAWSGELVTCAPRAALGTGNHPVSRAKTTTLLR